MTGFAEPAAPQHFRIRVRPDFRAIYPAVPDGWLRAHRRRSDRGAFWLDTPVGPQGSSGLPMLEPHLDVEPVERPHTAIPHEGDRRAADGAP
ncbi:MAG TPA: hypothetical protein VMY76_03950 [Gemmatimonadales bacterium]|nr:hypothetical protein [Gemmatimonadales bacterium]